MGRTVTIFGIEAEVPDDPLFTQRRASPEFWQARIGDEGPWFILLSTQRGAIRTFAAIASASWRVRCGRREDCQCQCTCAACVMALPWQRIFEKAKD